MKDRMRFLRDIIVKHSKIVFPIIIIVAVAITVAFALGADNVEEEQGNVEKIGEVVPQSSEEIVEEVIPEVPLTRNEDGALYSLAATYYNALANGDVETIEGIKNYMVDTEKLRIRELSKYIESYPVIEIYTKPGPEENSYVMYMYTLVTFYGYDQQVPGLETAYVCTDENGNLYMNEGETEEKVLEYLKTVNLQDDVVELNNRVNVEFKDLMMNNSKLFDYLSELDKQVTKVVGEILAEQVAGPSGDSNGNEQQNSESEGQTGAESDSQNSTASQGPVYAKATTTVNVRKSDSEQADKLGKVSGGTRVKVAEQLANGWTKIVYEGKDGYIKSEYLQVEASTTDNNSAGDNTDAGKKVTATTNVNLRKSPSQTAEKIGVVVGGDTLEVLSEYNDWSQVRYNGMVGYVKSEYIQ